MEKEEKRMTKREYFEQIKGIIKGTKVENENELIYFLESQIESIDKKALKAKERAVAKKEAGDELREIVKSVLTNDFQTAEEITAKINVEDISKAKVIARLTQLVNLGEVEKTDIKDESGKTRKAYKLA